MTCWLKAATVLWKSIFCHSRKYDLSFLTHGSTRGSLGKRKGAIDNKKARQILGVSQNASAYQVEEAFRKITLATHPDLGGSDEGMTELLAARDLLLESISQSKALVSVDTIRTLAQQVIREADKSSLLISRANTAKENVRIRSVNKLKQYRGIAAIAAAILTASMFVNKELSVDLLVPSEASYYERRVANIEREIAFREENLKGKTGTAPLKGDEPDKMSLNDDQLSKLQDDALTYQRIADEKKLQTASYTRIWRLAILSLIVCAGATVWYFNRKINRIESILGEFDENTTSKQLLYNFLREVFCNHVSSWTITDLIEAVDNWGNTRGPYQAIVHQVGPIYFSQYILSRAKQSGIVVSIEEFNEGGYIERFVIGCPKM